LLGQKLLRRCRVLLRLYLVPFRQSRDLAVGEMTDQAPESIQYRPLKRKVVATVLTDAPDRNRAEGTPDEAPGAPCSGGSNLRAFAFAA
jgi:hypothetical protein